VQNGSCASDNSAAALITVTPISAGGTVSNDQTICSGGIVAALTLTGNSGTVTTWQSANNPTFTGATNISGTAGLTSFTPTSVTTTTYFRAVVQNGSCASASSVPALITVTPASAGGTVGSDQTICSGGIVAALTLTGNTGTVTTWQSANNPTFTGATNISGTAGLTSFTPTGVTTTTYFRAVVQNGSCASASSVSALITVNSGSVGGTVNGATVTCNGASTTLTLSGNTGNVVQWESAVAPFTTYTPIANTTTTLITPTITQTTRFRAVVQSGSCSSANSNEFELQFVASGLWLGINSSNWNDALNWCGGVPTASTNVFIPAGTLFNPQVNITNAVVNNLTIEPGAILTISGISNRININGDFVNSGTFNTGLGTVGLVGSGTQNIAGFTVSNLVVNGSGAKNLTGNVTVNATLDLTNGNIQLGSNNLTIGSAATIINATAASYIVTNGTGNLEINNLTTTRTFPVGNGSYTPVVITNNGTADNYSVKVLNGVFNVYAGEVGTSPITTRVVNRTFIINEAVAGGSNLNIQFQWNNADELPPMDRSQTIVGRYNAGVWSNILSGSVPASGSNPYTVSIVSTNTGIFGVGDINSPLPVKIVSFTAALKKGIAKLNWVTASEINNSHFDVERSTDGVNFVKIGKVTGRGNSSTRVDYLFDDINAGNILESNNIIYYRLKQVGFSGNTEYSKVISISQFSSAVFEVQRAVPNPFNNETVISFKTSSIAPVTLQIMNQNGMVVYETNITPVEGANNYTLKFEDEQLSAGVYAVRMVQDGTVQVIRIVKR
jgi:hypothetical protein